MARPKKTTTDDVLELIRERDREEWPVVPTSYVVDAFDARGVEVSSELVRRRLSTLVESGEVKKQKVGGGAVFWPADETVIEGERARETSELVEQYGVERLQKAAEILGDVDDDGIEVLETVASRLEHGADEQEIIKAVEAATEEIEPGRESGFAKGGLLTLVGSASVFTYGLVSGLYTLGWPASQLAIGLGGLGIVGGFSVFLAAVIYWNLRRARDRLGDLQIPWSASGGRDSFSQ